MTLTQEARQIVAQADELTTQIPHLCFLEIVAQHLIEPTLHLPTVEKAAHQAVPITLKAITILEESTAPLPLLITTTLTQDRVVLVPQAEVVAAVEVLVEVAEVEVDKTFIYPKKL